MPEAVSDPRRNVSSLSDALPFALFPVRIETRFGTVGSGESTQHKLWVRIIDRPLTLTA